MTYLTDIFFCRCQHDPTLGFFPLNSTSFGYRYQTFKFVNFDQVFLHCKAFVCLVSEKSAECDRSCNSTTNTTPAPSGRRRREAIVRTSYTKPIYHIQSPPLSFSRRNEDNSIIRQWNVTTSTLTILFKYEDHRPSPVNFVNDERHLFTNVYPLYYKVNLYFDDLMIL